MTAPAITNLSLTFTTIADDVTPVAGFSGTASITAIPGAIPADAMTLEFWICTTQSTAASVIVSCGSGSGQLTISNPAALSVSMGGVAAPATAVSVADGLWHQVAVTIRPFSSTTLTVQIYVDGAMIWTALALTGRAAGAWPAADSTLVLGGGFVGQLSEFRIWDGVRSAADIITDMSIRVLAGGTGPVLEWPLTSAPTGTTSSGVAYATPSPTLLFLDTRTLLARWDSAGADASYLLIIDSGCLCPQTVPVAAGVTEYEIDDFTINLAYKVSVSAVVNDETGTASEASVTTLDLGMPVPQEAVSTGKFGIVWPAIDQAGGYWAKTTSLLAGVSSSSNSYPSSPTLDLTALAFGGADNATYQVASTGTGITGPFTVIPTVPSAPGVSLTYDQALGIPGTLTATLSSTLASAPYLLNLTPAADATAAATQLLAAGTATGDFGLYTPDNSDPVTFTITAQGVPLGAIGSTGTATATLWDLAAPIITSVTADTGNQTVTVAFTYGGATPAGLDFYVVLVSVDDPSTALATATVTTSPAVLTSAAISDGAALEARVRALADGSAGTWSAWHAITITAPAQVQITAASFNASYDATVAWQAVNGTAITYQVRFYDSGTLQFTSASTADTTATLLQSQTGANKNGTYTVTVTATSAGIVTGPASSAAPVTMPAAKKKETSGDPIDVSTGANLYANTDMAVTAVVPLVFSTYYSGVWPTQAENPLIPASPLGSRWSHDYMTQLVFSGTAIYLVWGHLEVETFEATGSGAGYMIPAGVTPGTLLYRASDGTFTLTQPDASRYVFSAAGLLTTLFDRYGNSTSVSYASGLPYQITDAVTGRTLTLGYADGWLRSVTDPLGNSVQYDQDGGNLTSVTDAQGNERQFTYTGASLMKAAVDGNGNTVFENTYTDNRITGQQDARALADGADYGFSFSYVSDDDGGIAVLVTSGLDAEGNAFSYTTQTAVNAVTEIDQDLGSGRIRRETRTFDGVNNLVSRLIYLGPSDGYVAGMGNLTRYSYDGNGNAVTEVTALSTDTVSAVSRSFDNAGNMLYQAFYEGPAAGFTQGAGNRWTYEYNSDNTLSDVTDPLKNVTRFTYGDNALLQDMTDPYGNVTQFDYTDGDLTQVTDPQGTVTTYVPDDLGRPVTITITSGGVTLSTLNLTYNKVSQVLQRDVMLTGQPAAQAFTTKYGYDGNGNRITVTDATGTLTRLDYNPNNFLSQITYAPYGGVTRFIQYTYDRMNAPQSQVMTSNATTPAPVTVQFVCDILGQPVTVTDPEGNVYSLDIGMVPAASGPLAQRQATSWPLLDDDPATYTGQTLYDPIGRPLAITDRAGQTIAIAYATQTDAASGTLQSVETRTYPATATQAATSIVTVRDALGRVVSRTDQNGHTTTVIYGSTPGDDGTVWTSATATDANGVTRVQARDPEGRLVSDSLGDAMLTRTHRFTYDGLDRLTSQTTSQGTATTTTSYVYGFDTDTGCWTQTLGRPGASTGATIQSYNGVNQLMTSLPPYAAAALAYAYTPWGGVAAFTNAAGQTLNYQFDDALRLLQTTIPGADPIAYTLDANGSRKIVTQGTATVQRTFDTWNRMSSRTGVDGGTVGYNYWPEDQVKTLTYVSGVAVSYQIDALGRLTGVADWTLPTARQVTYSYTADNQLNAIAYPNGAQADYDYDAGGRLTDLTITSAGLVVAQWHAEYDALNQLSQVTAIDPVAPTMPAADNIITYADSNQIITINGEPAYYNADGAYTGNSASTPQITYDSFGRVTGSSLTAMPTVTYGYDPDGLRTSTTNDGVASNLVYDINGYRSPVVERGDPVRALVGARVDPNDFGSAGTGPVYADGAMPDADVALDRLLEVFDGSGTVQARFLYGHGLLGQADALGTMAWFHPDSVGNLWASTGSDGAVVGAALFGPFGTLYGQTGNGTMPFGYGGLYGVQTDGSGLIGMRARSYMAAQMRFQQPDYLVGSPFRPQSLNRYAFVQGNPLQYVDPLGLSWQKSLRKSISKTVDKLGDVFTGLLKFGAVVAGLALAALAANALLTPKPLPPGGDGGGDGGDGGAGGPNPAPEYESLMYEATTEQAQMNSPLFQYRYMLPQWLRQLLYANIRPY